MYNNSGSAKKEETRYVCIVDCDLLSPYSYFDVYMTLYCMLCTNHGSGPMQIMLQYCMCNKLLIFRLQNMYCETICGLLASAFLGLFPMNCAVRRASDRMAYVCESFQSGGGERVGDARDGLIWCLPPN